MQGPPRRPLIIFYFAFKLDRCKLKTKGLHPQIQSGTKTWMYMVDMAKKIP